jgi:hypothetical protein
MPNLPYPQYGHLYWAIWPISLQRCSVIVFIDGKANGERKEAMIARFDHRPRLTAALALATIVLVVVVVTLSTLLITAAPPAAPALSGSVGDNTPVMGAGGEHYGEGWNNYGHDEKLPVMGAGGEHYGEGWNNYGHDELDQ